MDWFISYLQNRKQYVNINSVDSSIPEIKYCVPPSSILGLLLFITYINDIVHSSSIAKFIMFADDTDLFFKPTNLETRYNIINFELAKIYDWTKLNKLSLNIKN